MGWLMKAQLFLILTDSWTQHCALLPVETVNLEERSHCKGGTNTRSARQTEISHIALEEPFIAAFFFLYRIAASPKLNSILFLVCNYLDSKSNSFSRVTEFTIKGSWEVLANCSVLLIMHFFTKEKQRGADLLTAFFQTPKHQLRFKKGLNSLLITLKGTLVLFEMDKMFPNIHICSSFWPDLMHISSILLSSKGSGFAVWWCDSFFVLLQMLPWKASVLISYLVWDVEIIYQVSSKLGG